MQRDRSETPPLRRLVARVTLVAFVATLPGAPAFAELVGEQVVAGDASFERDGDVTTIHASDGAIIQYDRFSVWSNEELHFVQPHSQARVLNRVLGDPTHIDGGLFANGIVYIVNPAGIFFGSEAVVEVGGLYAAAGNITNEDFLAGDDRFELTGVVENAGRIESPSVALLGRAVANRGEIAAPDGTIALVAGGRVVLTRLAGHLHVEIEGDAGLEGEAAIEQTGSVDAGAGGSVSFTTGDVYSLALNHEGITRGGRIELHAARGLVRVAGLLDASDLAPGATGGEIEIRGERVALLGAVLDASGDAGGGEIRVGGDLRGVGERPNAKRTFVDGDSVLRADAVTRGDGGTVIVYADEATAFHGAISARGGAEGGDGGFAEISGAVFLWSDGEVDLRAAHGETGTLLYDPKDIVLAGGVADGDDDPDGQSDHLEMASIGEVLFGEPDELASPFTIHESEIEGTDANIVLEATNSITAEDAALFTNDSGEGAGVLRIADGRSLTLRTRNDPGDAGAATAGIDLGSLAILASGGGGVLIETGTGTEEGNSGGDIVVGDITTAGDPGASGGDAGDVTLAAGGDGAVVAGAIVATGGDGSDAAGGAGGVVRVTTVNGSIDVAAVDVSGGASTSADPEHAGGDAGSIALVAGDGDASGDSDIAVGGNLVADGGGATVGDGGAGGTVEVRTQGVPTPIAVGPGEMADLDPVVGGGDLSLAFVSTRGGAGGANGGAGGNVLLGTDGSVFANPGDGAITVGGIGTAGGAGGTDGGRGGGVVVDTRDADQSGDNHVTIGFVVTDGGEGAAGAGGSGGGIEIRTQRSEVVRNTVDDEDPDNDVLQEALGGGDVRIGTLDANGADGGTRGGNNGGMLIVAAGAGRVVEVTGDVNATGGDGGSGRGGSGFSVEFRTDDGAITLAGVDASGGATASVADPMDEGSTAADGGDGGTIRIEAGDADTMGDSDVTVTGDLVARGGAAAEGDGGTGGRVSVTAAGVRTPLEPPPGEEDDFAPTRDPFLGGGALSVGDIDTRGGDSALGSGGTGGRIALGATFSGNNPRPATGDGPIEAGVLDSSGGAGDTAGGNAGAVFVRTLDSDASNDADIRLEEVRAIGGSATGADGVGGRGGQVEVRTFARELVTKVGDPETVYQDDVGGGSVTIDRVDTSGGGGRFGGSAGRVGLLATGQDADDTLTVTGGVVARGGSSGTGDGSGGNGAIVELGSRHAPLAIDFPVDTRGGDASAEGGSAGRGGFVLFQTGIDGDEAPADVTIGAMPDTRGGLGPDGRAPSGQLRVNSTGHVFFPAGPIELWADVGVFANQGFSLPGTLDTHADAETEASFFAEVEASTTSTIGGDIGSNRALEIVSVDLGEEPADPELRIEGSSITTTGSQLFAPDTVLAGDTGFDAGTTLAFGGDLDADPAATSSVATISAPGGARFGGDVGAATALSGLDVSAAQILFDAEGDQRVVTDGAAGIRLDGNGSPTAIPASATIGKIGGGLRLESQAGDVIVGDGDKLSVAGRLDLIGQRVRFTDLSALEIGVSAATTEIFARELALVQLPNGALVPDSGTDLVANSIVFSAAPTLFGAGAAPRLATLTGNATNAGGLDVVKLQDPVTASDIASADFVFDLVIPTPDPGLETPELEGGAIQVPAGLYPSDDAAGPAAPVSPAEVVAWLACAPAGDPAPPADCAGPPPAPPYASALDTERAGEAAVAWRRLLGASERAVAGREALARTSRDPAASLAGSEAAGRSYLQEAARLLALVRMLGLPAERHGEVRGALLAGLVAAIGAPELDAERLLAGIEAYSMGMEI